MILALTLTAGFGLVLSGFGILLIWSSHRTLMEAYADLEDRVHYLEIAQRKRDEYLFSSSTRVQINAEVANTRARQRPVG